MAPMELYSPDNTGYDRAVQQELTGKVGVRGVYKIVFSNVRNLRYFLTILYSHELEFVSCWLERDTKMKNMFDCFDHFGAGGGKEAKPILVFRGPESTKSFASIAIRDHECLYASD